LVESAGRSRRSSAKSTSFLLCVDPGEHEDLQARRLYEALPDESAATSNYVRVIDDSGEDYLYPASHFLELDLPDTVRAVLAIRKTL
jgi:hypothetical protein